MGYFFLLNHERIGELKSIGKIDLHNTHLLCRNPALVLNLKDK